MPVDEELMKFTERLGSWNPMRDDYTNSQFNKYSSGPGAYLDPALQPAQLARNENRQQQVQPLKGDKNVTPVPYLVFKNIPKGTTKKVIYNMCARHGDVKDVRDSQKNCYFFADFATVAEMEAVYRALVNNNYGFHVFIGKQMCKKNETTQYHNGKESLPPIEMDKNVIDLESRDYRASEKHLPRPVFKRNPIVNPQSYESKDSLLQRNDPLHHFLIVDDAHALERAGLKAGNPKGNMHNTQYKYRTGRAYIELSEKSKSFIEAKTRQSLGSYDASRHIYENTHNGRKIGRPKDVGQCANCQCACDIVCARCQTYFCGFECQRKAWPQHRQTCGREELPNSAQKLPEANTSNKTLTANIHTVTKVVQQLTATNSTTASSMPVKPLPLKNIKKSQTPITQSGCAVISGNLAKLTSISKTNVVFIRPKTCEDNLSFLKFINDVQSAGKNLNKLSELPKCGQIVIVDFEGQYNRAMVLNNDDEQRIKLVYIDYGNLDARKYADLYEAPQRFIDVQRFAIPVVLKNVPDSYMTEEIRKFMYSYLDGIDMVVRYNAEKDLLAAKGVYQVELIDETTNQNFNKMVAKLCKPREPLDSDEVYFVEYLTQEQLPEGENVELAIMDNSLLCTGCISCTTREWANEIEQFQKDLQLYAESLRPQCYTPRDRELCIAKYDVDGKWYRGRCLETVGDGYPSIIFIDYGNIAMVNVKDIRRYPAQFTFPIYTCDCEIKGLPEQCKPDLVKKLEELIPNGSTIRCDRITFYNEENFHGLILINLIQKLKAEGLLNKD